MNVTFYWSRVLRQWVANSEGMRLLVNEGLFRRQIADGYLIVTAAVAPSPEDTVVWWVRTVTHMLPYVDARGYRRVMRHVEFSTQGDVIVDGAYHYA